MKKILGISMVAVLAVAPFAARADIASTGYVTNAISGKANTADLASVATSGSYNDLSNKPAIPTVTDTYSATGTEAVSGKAVASAISGKANTADLKSAAYAETTAFDAAGTATSAISTLTTKLTSATNNVKVLNATNADNATNATNATKATQDGNGDTIATTYQKIGNMVLKGASESGDYANKYPSYQTTKQMIVDTVNDSSNVISGQVDELMGQMVKHTEDTAAGSATVPVYVDADGTAKAITSYSGRAATAGTADTVVDNAITSAKIQNKTIINDDISDTAAIDQSKISGLTTALGNKQDKVLSSGYKAATASANITAGTTTVEQAVGQLEYKVGTKQDANTAVKHTSGTAAGSASVPVYVDASGNATAITSYSGKAATAGTADTVLDNAITSAKIANGTIENADIKDGTITMAKTELPSKDVYANNGSGVLTKQTTVNDGRYTLVMNKKGTAITYEWEFIGGENARE